MYSRQTKSTRAAFDLEAAEAQRADASYVEEPPVARLFDATESHSVEDASQDAASFIIAGLRRRPVLSRAAERALFQRYEAACRRLERLTERSPVVAAVLLGRLREAGGRPEALAALLTSGPDRERAAARSAELADKAIVALDAVLADVATAPPHTVARLRVWLGRAVRAVRFTPAALTGARAEAFASADRAAALAEEARAVASRLECRTPAVADKRRHRAIERELRAISDRRVVSADALVAFGATARRAERACEALRTEIVESNLRLVVSVVKGFARYGLPLADLVQEGAIGLMRAADRFEWRRGNKFSTYAVAWIRQAAQLAIDSQSRTIRLPAHSAELLRRVTRAQREASEALGRELTAEELAGALGVPAAGVRAVRRAAPATVPLDAPLAVEGHLSLADTIADRAQRPDELLLRADLREKIEEALATLTPREEAVVRMRFGLGDDGCEHTLEEVARVFGVTRERIRQIEMKALDRLREPRRSEKLRHYAE